MTFLPNHLFAWSLGRCEAQGAMPSASAGECWPGRPWDNHEHPSGQAWPSPVVVQAARTGSVPTPRCAVRAKGDGGPRQARAPGRERCSQLCFYSTRKTLHAFDAKWTNYTFMWINYFKTRELYYLFVLTLRGFYWKTSAVKGGFIPHL